MTSLNHLMSLALQGPESSAASELESPAFSLREVKALRQDLFPPKPFVYWGDLLLTVVAYGLAAVYLTAPAFSWIQVGALLLSGLALFPVGLRYHALHHLFPSPLYRALGEAHRRLLQALPVDSPYRCTIRTGFIQAVRELLAYASLAATSNQNPMQLWRNAEVEP